jgi:CheY-like chemotaxis protein
MSAATGCDNIVMVVEDDGGIRESLMEVLEDNEYQPIGAANGKEAIDRLRALHDRPCVILLDLMMPVMDGREFRALLLQDAELGAIPVVILTAHANLRDAAEGMAAAACLKKPVQLDVLLQIIHRFCRPTAAA